jgi:AhpD family alkylhydroperoxidase
MTKFTNYDANNAPEKSKSSLEGAQKQFGFLPNLSVSDIFGKSSLNEVEQQVVLIAVSVENSCEYCVAAHSLMAKHSAKADAEIVAELREGKELSDPKLNALASFSRSVTRERGFVSEKTLQSFLEAGYSKENILDVITGVTQKTLSNYVNHISKTPLDDQFASEKWMAIK